MVNSKETVCGSQGKGIQRKAEWNKEACSDHVWVSYIA